MNFDIYTLLEHSPALIVAIPLLGAFLTPLLGKINDKVRNIFVIIVSLVTIFFVGLLAQDILFNDVIYTYVFGGGPATYTNAEGGHYAVRIMFEIDAMSIFMAIVASILSFAAIIYSWAFIDKETGQSKYYTLLLLMTAGILGMVSTGDLFNFFVFLEITSISSCALIAFWTNKGKSIDAALKYIVISTIGALFFLFAIGIFYAQYNALNIAVIANNIGYTFLDKIALVLIISSLAMKAGLVPMHMWLPDAYGRAPATVSIMLVGATQASLYGVLRMIFTLYGTQLNNVLKTFSNTDLVLNEFLSTFIIALALFTIIIGVFMALKESHLKRMIAYAALAELGYMFLAIGAALSTLTIDKTTGLVALQQGGPIALQGGIFHIINDALDVGLLFLVAGAIYYATKEENLDRMGGLARNMKYTTIFFIIGLLAVAGMPPMNGFASKILIYESIYQVNPILAIVAILGSIMLLAIFIKVFYSAFLGPKIPRFDKVQEAPKSMLIGMGVIACIIIFFGLFPNLILENLIQPAAEALVNHGRYINHVVQYVGGAL